MLGIVLGSSVILLQSSICCAVAAIQVDISSNSIAKLIGKLFILKSAVNLLSSVLDTPEFFWRAPDSFQSLYERICEYLELGTRTDVLNSRFAVMQEVRGGSKGA